MEIIKSKTLKIWLVGGKVTIAKCLKTGKFVSHIVAKAVLSAIRAIKESKVVNKYLWWSLQNIRNDVKSIADYYADRLQVNDLDVKSNKRFLQYNKACNHVSDEVRYIYDLVFNVSK